MCDIWRMDVYEKIVWMVTQIFSFDDQGNLYDL